jgi:6-pyruvoyltetrahydropterin/6-carboxytetrahydropterin synthase
VKLTLTRRYSFSASHRLHSALFNEEENQRIYGKCANPYGHGHNYIVDVTLGGPPDECLDESTGMIVNLADLDEFVQREVIEPFDHVYINEQVAEFRGVVPTTENLCREIFKRLQRFPLARLERVRIEETSKNSFEMIADTDGHRKEMAE